MTKHPIWMSGNVEKRQANCDIGAFQRISDVPPLSKPYVFLGFWAHGQFTVTTLSRFGIRGRRFGTSGDGDQKTIKRQGISCGTDRHTDTHTDRQTERMPKPGSPHMRAMVCESGLWNFQTSKSIPFMGEHMLPPSLQPESCMAQWYKLITLCYTVL
jgi:hypothetical protein